MLRDALDVVIRVLVRVPFNVFGCGVCGLSFEVVGSVVVVVCGCCVFFFRLFFSYLCVPNLCCL